MKHKRRKRLLFASVDIGWRIRDYSAFISKHPELGLSAKSLVYYFVDSTLYTTNYDTQLNIQRLTPIKRILRKAWCFVTVVPSTDVFHFFSGETLLNRKLRSLEFKLYRILGRRIIMHFVGSDIRDPKMLFSRSSQLEEKGSYLKNAIQQTEWQKKLVQDAEKYAHSILVSTPDLLSLFSRAHYFPVLLDIEKYRVDIEIARKRSNPKLADKIVILHSPSGPKTKGTAFIDKVMEKVIMNCPHKVEYVNPAHAPTYTLSEHYQVSRYDLFTLMLNAHIVIDQMSIGWYGLQSIEALMSGASVICNIEEQFDKYRPSDCPIIACSPEQLEETVLKQIDLLIHQPLDPSKQQDWVIKNHTISQRNNELIEAWTGNAQEIYPDKMS
jgi:hypothetical protein